MRARTVLFQLVWLAMLLTASTVLLAQEPLTQTFTSADGQFTMSYPEGWTVTEDDGLLNFGSGSSFLQVSYHDYGDNVTMLEILEIGATALYGFSEPESVVVGGWPGLRAVSSDQHHTLVNFCDGTMALIIGFGDSNSEGPTWEAMMDTLRYGVEEPQLCRGAFEGLQAMTAANAASIAPLTTLGDMGEAVQAVAFSADGKLLAAGYTDGTVQLWSLLTGEEQGTLTGHTGGATSLSFDEGGYQIVAGTGGGQVRGWDVATGDSMSRLQEHGAGVTSVARQPGGFLIASGAADGSVRVYDMLMGSERPALSEPVDIPVTGIAFSPDGTRIAAVGGDTLRLWDAETGTVVAAGETSASNTTSLAFRPDGAQLVFAGDGAVWLWDLAGEAQALGSGLPLPVTTLAVHPDGTLIAAAGEGVAYLLDAATGAVLAELDLTESGVLHSVAFSTDGALLAIGGDTGGVQLFTATGEAAAAESAAETTTSTTETTTTAATCTINAPSNANLRSGPGTDFDRAGSLVAGQTAEVDGQAVGSDGLTWFRLTDGTWARSDVISTAAECAGVPVVEG